jgi:hypothetical protein
MNGESAPLMITGATDGWMELQRLADDMHASCRDATALAMV